MLRKILFGFAVSAGAVVLVLPNTAFAATSGVEHFHITSTSPNGNRTIIASGVFAAGGTSTPGNKRDTVTFSNGTFKIDHSAITPTFHFDSSTCTATGKGSGPYTLGSGTGAYAGISGGGQATVHIRETASKKKDGSCSNHVTAFEFEVSASGDISLP
jgi:hypothetical protein